MEQHAHIDLLITLHLQGEANQDQQLQLQEWIGQSAENLRYYTQMEEAYFMAPTTPHAFAADVAWNKVSAQLTSPQAKVVKWGAPRLWFAAASMAVLIAGIWWVSASSSQPQLTWETQAGAQTYLLPNGTTMTMNAHSKAMCMETAESVEIELNGSAYFEVKEHGEKTFVVRAGEFRILDIGTAFQVLNWEENDSVFVQVDEGEVMCFGNRDSLRLQKGQRGFFHKRNGSMGMREVRTNESSFATKRFTYNEASIKQVLLDLNEVYGTSITVTDTSMLECTISVTFNHQPLEEILEVLSITMGWQVEQNQGAWVFSGPACETPL